MALSKTQTIFRYGIYGLLGLVILGLLVYVFVIRTIQIHNQRQNFAKAEASLDALEQQIEAKVGKPDEIKKDKSCDRPNLKYGKGPLGCHITIYLLYQEESAENANKLMGKLLSFGDSKIRIGSGAAQGNSFADRNTRRGEQTFYQDTSLDTQLACTLGYTYPAVDHEAFSVKSMGDLQINLSCGGPAMAEFYPVKN